MDTTTAVGRWLNLGALGLVAGMIGIFLVKTPRNFWKHWITKYSFLLWLAQWLAYVVFYAIWSVNEYLFKVVNDDPHLVTFLGLPILDVGSLCHFFSALVLGSTTDPTRNFWEEKGRIVFWISLIVLGSAWVLFPFNLLIGEDYRLSYRLVCISPSILMSNIAIIFLGWIFLVRYNSHAAKWLFALCLVYAFTQMPSYIALFSFSLQIEPALKNSLGVFIIFLAPMKVLLATLLLCLFYTPFTDTGDMWPEQGEVAGKWIPAAPVWPTKKPVPLRREAQALLVWAVLVILAVGVLFGSVLRLSSW